MIHPLDLMTERESNAMLTNCLNAVKERVPTNTAFIVIIDAFGDRPEDHVGGLYGSNANPVETNQ